MDVQHSGPAKPGRLTGAEWLLLLVLAAVQFAHLVDFMIVMPLGPLFIRELAISPQAFGVLVSAYGFSASLSGLLAARFVDRFDRKRALLVLYAGFTAGTLLCAVASDYWLLLIARAVAGGFGGVAGATLLAVIGDAFPYERRGTAMGVIMSSFSVALIVGVPLGLFLANALGWRAPFSVLGGLSVLVLLAAWVILPPLRGHLNAAPSEGESAGLLRVLLEPNHLRAYALMAAVVFGGFLLAPYLATYLVANVGVAEGELFWVYLVGGALTLGTTNLFGRLADRYGKLRVFRLAALSTVPWTLLLANLPPTPLVVVVLVSTLLMVTGSGRMVPAQAMMTAAAAPRYRGSFMSVNSSVQQMAIGLASILGGLVLGVSPAAGEGPAAVAGGKPLAPLEGYGWVGLLAAGFTVLSVFLAGFLRPAQGGLGAVDGPAAAASPAEGLVEGSPATVMLSGEVEPAQLAS
jgi:predicted MFS family arabinose efflux permease